jgi:hypothetical protein
MLNTNLLHYLESHLRVVWRFNGGFNDCRQHYTFHTKSTRPKFSILAKHFKKITPIHYLHSYHMNTHTDRQRPALITSVCIIFPPKKVCVRTLYLNKLKGPIGCRGGEKMEEKFFKPYISIFCMV